MESLPTFSPDVIRRLITQVEFFNDFSEAEQKCVLQYMDAFLRFKPQEIILEQGRQDDLAMFVLLTGRAVITSGHKKTYLDEVMSGEFFGEIAFLTEEQRTANVIAAEACIVWRISHDLLNAIPIELREKIKDKIILKLARVIVKGNQKISNIIV